MTCRIIRWVIFPAVRLEYPNPAYQILNFEQDLTVEVEGNEDVQDKLQ